MRFSQSESFACQVYCRLGRGRSRNSWIILVLSKEKPDFCRLVRTPCPCSSCIKSRNPGDLDQTDSLSHQHPRARRSHRKKSELCKAGAWISTHEIRPLRKFGMLLRVVVARAFKLIHDWYIDMKAVCPNTLVESLLARVFDLVGLIASSHKSRRSPASCAAPSPGKPPGGHCPPRRGR